jgi:hypothetical protein
LLFYEFNITRPSGFFDPWLGGAVEAQDAKPAFVGNGLEQRVFPSGYRLTQSVHAIIRFLSSGVVLQPANGK